MDDDVKSENVVSHLEHDNVQSENDDSEFETGQHLPGKGRPQGSPLQANIVGGNKWAGVNPAPTAKSATIGEIMGAYKSLVANEYLKIHKLKFEGTGLIPSRLGKIWQRDFNDHIIRNEQSYQHISNYIVNNPKNWKDDTFFNP